jgi:hypothetical protein
MKIVWVIAAGIVFNVSPQKKKSVAEKSGGCGSRNPFEMIWPPNNSDNSRIVASVV